MGIFSFVAGTPITIWRLGTLPLLNGEKIVLRILPELQRRSSLAALGFTEENQSALLTLLEKARGMVVITGPTNSGKTTTLYACLKQLAAQGQLVYTIEDPIEAVLPEVQQMQVNALSGFSFAAGLRGMLAQRSGRDRGGRIARC